MLYVFNRSAIKLYDPSIIVFLRGLPYSSVQQEVRRTVETLEI